MRVSGLIMVFVLVILGSVPAFSQLRDDYTMPNHPDVSKSVQIFPNPAPDYVHVRLDQVKVQKVKVTLHNIIGNEMVVEVEIIDEHEVRIKVKDLSAGYYLISLKDDDSKFKGVYKFLKR